MGPFSQKWIDSRTNFCQIEAIKALAFENGELSTSARNLKEENSGSVRDILRWCNKKNDVPILEAMQKVIALYNN